MIEKKAAYDTCAAGLESNRSKLEQVTHLQGSKLSFFFR